MDQSQANKILIDENIAIKDENRVAIRSEEYRCFWYLVEFANKELSKSENGIHKRAFLLNSAVMAVMTIESLLNDLAEFYLPTEIWDCLFKQSNTKLRMKEIIKSLTGQYSEYEIKNGAKVIKIKKIGLDDFFKLSSWDKFCELIKIRNKIVHCKVEDIVTNINGEAKIKGDVREDWSFDVDDITPLTEGTRKFVLELKLLLEKSVDDCIKERLISRFNFLS